MDTRRVLAVINAGMFALMVLLASESKGAEEGEASVPIRIGWQIPQVTQAAIVQVLKRTDVLTRYGLEPSLIPFSFGTPEVEAALAGELDALFAGDQPAINLLAHGGKWKVVARLYYDKVSVIVPPGSPIRTIADLRGKTVASPFGSISHREAFLEQQAAGLDPEKEVKNLDVDILKIRDGVLDGGVETWEEFEAAAVWEPHSTAFQLSELARNLSDTPALGVVAISDEFIAKNPEATVQFLVGLVRAWDFFSRNPDRVMRWYNDDTHLDYRPESLISAVEIDPNFSAKSIQDISLELDETHIDTLVKNTAWGVEAWEGGNRIRQFIDQDLLSRAMQELATGQFEEIQVILPSIRAVEELKTVDSLGLDAVPLGVVFAIIVLIALLAIEAGRRLGKRRKEALAKESVRPIGTIVGAVLGMMAFVIAITFGAANNRFDARKTALLEDVTAIQTAYLRADLLPEPHRTTVRSLLRDYVQVRAGIVYAYHEPDTLKLVQRRADVLQESMWSNVRSMTESGIDKKYQIMFASTLNDVFNFHTKRVVLGAHYRIPGFLWLALVFAAGVAMVAVGFQFGIVGGHRINTADIALATTFALIMLLAFDLDRAGEGLIHVNQQPMIDLYQSMSQHQ